jgi:hypothetical protein
MMRIWYVMLLCAQSQLIYRTIGDVVEMSEGDLTSMEGRVEVTSSSIQRCLSMYMV